MEVWVGGWVGDKAAMAAFHSAIVPRMGQTVDNSHEDSFPFLLVLAPRITGPSMKPVLPEVPGTKTFIKRERRAITYALGRMSTVMLPIAGLDSKATPPVELSPPIVEYLIQQGDELTRNVGEHASIKHCTHESFEAQLRPLVKVRTRFQSTADEHQRSINDSPFCEYDQLMMKVPVYPIAHSYP